MEGEYIRNKYSGYRRIIMDKSILITGISGFLGNEIFKQISSVENKIVGLSRKATGIPEEKARIYRNVEELIINEDHFDIIFHLAAFIPYGNYNTPNPEFYSTNVELTARLSNAYPKSRFVYASSVSVYGQPIENPLTIHSPFNNPDLYGMSKLGGELVVRNHPDFSIIRYTSIIGRGMKPVSLIPKMIESAFTKKEITLYGKGERKQNYIDVRDAAKLAINLSEKSKNIICLGVGNNSHSNNEIAKFIGDKTGAKINYQGDDNSPSFFFNSSKEYYEIGFTPSFGIFDTIQEML